MTLLYLIVNLPSSGTLREEMSIPHAALMALTMRAEIVFGKWVRTLRYPLRAMRILSDVSMGSR